MIQHPIPQNVTGYQFRLIGDMTIKQFIYLSVGIGAAIAFYYTNLFFLIKWFFVILSATSGFAIAFLPFEERPLDLWLTNYLKAIYRPTYFIWKKIPSLPEYFSFVSNTPSKVISDLDEISRLAAIRRQQGLHSFLTTLPNDQHIDLDLTEQSQSQNLLSLFSQQSSTPPKTEVVIPPPSLSSPQTPPSSAATPSTPAITSTSLPFPSAPSTPNTLVGMVLGQDNKIIEGAIVEIVDELNFPVRATKTNQLGQFFSTTPLKRGNYRINIDKPGLIFDTIEIRLTGQVVDPLKIIAKPTV